MSSRGSTNYFWFWFWTTVWDPKKLNYPVFHKKQTLEKSPKNHLMTLNTDLSCSPLKRTPESLRSETTGCNYLVVHKVATTSCTSISHDSNMLLTNCSVSINNLIVTYLINISVTPDVFIAEWVLFSTLWVHWGNNASVGFWMQDLN